MMRGIDDYRELNIRNWEVKDLYTYIFSPLTPFSKDDVQVPYSFQMRKFAQNTGSNKQTISR